MFFSKLTPTVRNLLILNVGIFLIESFMGMSLSDIFGLRSILSDEFRPYQFFTYLFLHGGFGHLFSNMLALFIFGPLLEQFWGANKFLVYYLITGIGAGLLYGAVNYYEVNQIRQDAMNYVENPTPDGFNGYLTEHTGDRTYRKFYDFINAYAENPNSERYVEQSKSIVKDHYNGIAGVPMIGASGAVFGILLAFGYLFPNTQLVLLFPPIPIKAKYLVMFYGLYEVFAGVQNSPGDNVAHFAHIGGMLIGFIVLRFWKNRSGDFY